MEYPPEERTQLVKKLNRSTTAIPSHLHRPTKPPSSATPNPQKQTQHPTPKSINSLILSNSVSEFIEQDATRLYFKRHGTVFIRLEGHDGGVDSIDGAEGGDEDSELGQISDCVGRNMTHEYGDGKAEREDEGAIRAADDADPVAGRVGGVPLEEEEDQRHRLEHRIIISNAVDGGGGGGLNHRWSDAQASEMLYLRTEMIMSDSRNWRNRTIAHYWSCSKGHFTEAENRDHYLPSTDVDTLSNQQCSITRRAEGQCGHRLFLRYFGTGNLC
ncbi:unnamed protein product [Camellia sinensis]